MAVTPTFSPAVRASAPVKLSPGWQRAGGDGVGEGRVGGAVDLGLARVGGDGDGPLADDTGGVVDEGDGVVGAGVAVGDRAGRGERLAGADVAVVEGLGEEPVSVPTSVPPVMVGMPPSSWCRRRSWCRSTRGDGDGAGGDHAGDVVDEGDGVVRSAVAVDDGARRVRVLPVPTFLVSKVWVNDPVSVPASVPDVMVGIAARARGAVVGLGVGDGGDGDRAGGDDTGGVVGEGDGVVGATVAVTDRSGRRQRLGGADVLGVEGLGERGGVGAGEVPVVTVGTPASRGGS